MSALQKSHLPLTLFVLGVATLSPGCSRPSDPFGPVPMEWSEIPPPVGKLPDGVELERGVSYPLPLRAWAVLVDPSADGVRVGVAESGDDDGRATPSDLARDTDACVLVNGGFYWIDDQNRARHIGLLVRDSRVIEPPVDRVVWQQLRYPTARATLGSVPGHGPVVRWVNNGESGIRALRHPYDNALGRPALIVTNEGEPWEPEWALSAGPALVVDGVPRVTREQEAFFDAHIPRIHPRSAAGILADGRLVLLVVDGRQPRSRGVTLEELAVILQDLGAVWALNLDGGGSSTLVVNGRLVNRPAGTEREREIVSAITVNCS